MDYPSNVFAIHRMGGIDAIDHDSGAVRSAAMAAEIAASAVADLSQCRRGNRH